MTAEDIIYKLYEFYKVNNNLELAELLKTTPQTISNWKTRNSISAIKKKCRELRIYNDIFGDIENKILDTLNNEKKEEIKNSIDEDTMFHIQNLFTIAKRKNLLKELKTELSMMYLKYSTYDKYSKTEDGRSIFNDNIVFDALK